MHKLRILKRAPYFTKILLLCFFAALRLPANIAQRFYQRPHLVPVPPTPHHTHPRFSQSVSAHNSHAIHIAFCTAVAFRACSSFYVHIDGQLLFQGTVRESLGAIDDLHYAWDPLPFRMRCVLILTYLRVVSLFSPCLCTANQTIF